MQYVVRERAWQECRIKRKEGKYGFGWLEDGEGGGGGRIVRKGVASADGRAS